MVAVPTLAEEDAKRPSRERETLVGEASRIITRVKAAFVRLGIRSFNPKLRAAAERLGTLRSPRASHPAEHVGRAQARSGAPPDLKKQLREIEQTRLEHLAKRQQGPHPWSTAGPRGGHRCSDRRHAGAGGAVAEHAGSAPVAVMPDSPARPMKVGRNAERRDWPVRVKRAYGEA